MKSAVRLLALAFVIGSFSSISVGQSRIDGVIQPELAEQMRATKGSKSLDVIVYFVHQPGHGIAESLRRIYDPQVQSRVDQLQAIYRLLRPDRPMSEAEEKLFASRMAERKPSALEFQLASEIDEINTARTVHIARELAKAVEPGQAEFARRLARMGGRVTSRITVFNAVIAKIPADRIAEIAEDPNIAMMGANLPNGPELSTSVPSVLAGSFHSAGFTGGAFDAGVLDVSAVQQNHPAWIGKRFESNIGATDANGHPTNCAGIMASGDATNRGVAFGLDTIVSSQVNGTAVMMTNMNWMVTGSVEKPENINYSITDGTVNATDYAQVDQFFDGVISTFGNIVSKSAGNQGFGTGAPTITRPAPAYNLLACASVHDFANTSRTDDRISSYSSRGPTPAGRKKPDIAAPGENITSLARTGGFSTGSGTSFAAPHVGGAVILLLNRGVIDPLAAKAILINTTDAIRDFDTSATTDDAYVAGSYWDRRYGWGYMNLQRAFLHSTDYFSADMPAPAAGGRNFRLYKGFLFDKDKVTLAWNRAVIYSGAAFPTTIRGLSNLDIVGYNQLDNANLGQSVSAIDNVEQFHVNQNGEVVVKVYTVGTFDAAIAQQRYVLATEEGFTASTGPAFQITITTTNDPAPGSVAQINVNVKNVGDVPAHGVTAQFTTFPVVGAPTINVGKVNPGETKVATFSVQLPNRSVETMVRASVSSSSYGETWTGNGSGFLSIQ